MSPSVSPFLPELDPAASKPSSRQKLQLALVTRRKQLMPRLKMLKTDLDCAENNWTKWGRRREKTWIYGSKLQKPLIQSSIFKPSTKTNAKTKAKTKTKWVNTLKKRHGFMGGDCTNL